MCLNFQEIDDDDDDDDDQLVHPEMLFCPTEYNKTCKIGTRCRVSQTVEYIETNFTEEVKWFKNHPQFQHIFHMPKEPNHMSQDLWMLLLCTASTETKKECWFVVNGVPIRYSIKEHALLSGLDCGTYPKYYPTEIGDLKFVKKVFGRSKGIKVKDVEKKMKEVEKNNSTERKKMKRKRSTQKKKMSSINRLKLNVLYFLCNVVVAKSKSSRNIDKFILKVVDDLKTCEEFL